MLKGVNKQILEITNTESPYFEKIIFFVRQSDAALSESALQKEAEKYSKQTVKPPKTRRSKRETLSTLGCIALGIGAGIALTLIMGIIA